MMNAKKTIVAFEPLCRGWEHASFNAAFLTTIREAMPESRLIFFGDREHIDAVASEMGKNRAEEMERRKLKVASADAMYINKIISQAKLTWTVCRAARDHNALIVACAASELTLFFLRIYLSIFFRGVRAITTLHSMLKLLTADETAGFRRRIAGRFIVPFILKFAGSKNIRLLVLSASIETEILRLYPGLAPYISHINLPYLFESQEPGALSSGELRFGFIGLGSRDKGIDDFFRIAGEFRGTTGANKRKAVFAFIGPLSRDCGDMAIPEGVQVESKGGAIPRDRYNQAIGKCDYLIYPYRRKAYQLVASAALLDAVHHRKPILAYRLPFFEEYLKLVGSRACILCDDYGQLRESVKRIIMREDPESPIPGEVFQKAREYFSPEGNSGKMRKILEEWSSP
jgi:glycosyltransferase involved in cell wall biosynthesis